MPNTDNPQIDWQAFRFALDQLNRSVASLTDALEALYNTTDQPNAQVLMLDFGPAEQAPARALPSRADFPRQRAKWRFDEEQAIRSALTLGFDVAWIAQRLERTSKAVQRKIDHMRHEGKL